MHIFKYKHLYICISIHKYVYASIVSSSRTTDCFCRVPDKNYFRWGWPDDICCSCSLLTLYKSNMQMSKCSNVPMKHYCRYKFGFIWFYGSWIFFFLLALTKQNYKTVLLFVWYSQWVVWQTWFLGNHLQIPGVVCDRYVFLCLSSFLKMLYFLSEYGWPQRPGIELYSAKLYANFWALIVVIPTFINNLFLSKGVGIA